MPDYPIKPMVRKSDWFWRVRWALTPTPKVTVQPSERDNWAFLYRDFPDWREAVDFANSKGGVNGLPRTNAGY